MSLEVLGEEGISSLGNAALWVAFLTALFAVVAALVGGRRSDGRWVDSSRLAAYAVFGLLTVCFVALEVAFVTNDLSLEVVASPSSSTTPRNYPIFTVRWLSVHALGIPTVFFLGALAAMQFIRR